MGEARKEALRVDFDSQIKLEFHGGQDRETAEKVALLETFHAMAEIEKPRFQVRE